MSHPSGNIMAISSKVSHQIYGSSRLGEYRGGRKAGQLTTGLKSYELSNHLGNVLATVSDAKVAVEVSGSFSHFAPEVVSTSDYYPFGLAMEGRTFSSEGYRWGFNGMERDPQMGWGSTVYDYGFRIFSPKIGKFLSIDPLSPLYPWYTPYQFTGNKPIWFIDRDGLEEDDPLYGYDTWCHIETQVDKRTELAINGAQNLAFGVVGTIGSGIYISGTGGTGAAIGGAPALMFSLGEVGIGISQMVNALAAEEPEKNKVLTESSSIPGLISNGVGADEKTADFIDATGQFLPGLITGGNLKAVNNTMQALLSLGRGGEAKLKVMKSILFDGEDGATVARTVYNALDYYDGNADTYGFLLSAYESAVNLTSGTNTSSNPEMSGTSASQVLFINFEYSFTVEKGDNVYDLSRSIGITQLEFIQSFKLEDKTVVITKNNEVMMYNDYKGNKDDIKEYRANLQPGQKLTFSQGIEIKSQEK